MTQSLAEIMYL